MGLPTIAVPEYTLTIPSTKKEIKYRPFLVKEEKILLLAMETEDQKQIINATKTIIKNCVFGDIDVDTLATFDIEYIFLQLRGKAKGEDIELKYKCPKCENDIAVTVNTDEVQVLFKDDHTDNIKLTEHLGVIMKYPNIDSQLKIAEHEEKDRPEIEALFDTIVDSIDCIYDNDTTYASKDHTEKEMTDFLESLTDKQFQKISKFFETMPAIRHQVKLVCTGKTKGKNKKSCVYTEEITLEGLNSFFA